MSWQKTLSQGFASVEALLSFLKLPLTEGDKSAESLFKTRVPLGFAMRMEKGNPQDPLLLQVLAHVKENRIYPDYNHDPLNEKAANPIPGLIQKYANRVLLTLTGACAVHCRYCFRRHFPYEENHSTPQNLSRIIEYIQARPHINEVILSGGDPLLASDARLKQLLNLLEPLKQLTTLRIHSRIPIVLPERINDTFLSVFEATRLNKVMVLHTNHANELNKEVDEVCKKLKAHGFHLLNQSVLLHGVNDNATALITLSHTLFKHGVLPYYLHLLDKVQGAAHFDIPPEKIRLIYQNLQQALPGYLVPKLVKEEAGTPNKTIVGWALAQQ